jgi:nitrite reductase/ring-hydroxylating ferredoxin subunit
MRCECTIWTERGGFVAFVCKSTDIKPGQIAAFEVNSEIVAIANVDGKFFAVADECTHASCSLSQGDLWGAVINCPCHGGQFDLATGEVVGGPPLQPLKCYSVEVSGEDLRITQL